MPPGGTSILPTTGYPNPAAAAAAYAPPATGYGYTPAPAAAATGGCAYYAQPVAQPRADLPMGAAPPRVGSLAYGAAPAMAPDPYSVYQASFGATPYGAPQPTACATACASALDRGGGVPAPVSPPKAGAVAAERRAEAKRLARKPNTPSKAAGSYASAYALPATGLKPRALY